MATPAQQSSLATALLMLVKLKWSPSMKSYALLFVAPRNTTFKSLAEAWMLKLVQTETANLAYTTRQTEMDNIKQISQ